MCKSREKVKERNAYSDCKAMVYTEQAAGMEVHISFHHINGETSQLKLKLDSFCSAS